MAGPGRPAKFVPKPFVMLLTADEWQDIEWFTRRFPRLTKSDVVRGFIDIGRPLAKRRPMRLMGAPAA